MGIHESQSRFYENIIGRSQEFWTGFLPKLNNAAPTLQNLQLDPFIHAINRVNRSKIRIEADEVTYNLHIIIRFQIEQNLFAEQNQSQRTARNLEPKLQRTLGVEDRERL